jgi:chromosomal replication initiator protein
MDEYVSKIVELVSREFNVNPDMVKSKVRKRRYVQPRHVAVYLVKTNTFFSLKKIARNFGIKDHTSIIHAVEAINVNIEIIPSYKEFIESLQREILKNG